MPLGASRLSYLSLNISQAAAAARSRFYDFMRPVGGADISTDQAKFGTRSLKLDGSDDYVVIPPMHTDPDLTGDFTIEAWIYKTSTSGNTKIFDWRGINAGADDDDSPIVLAGTLLIDINGDDFRVFIEGSNRSSGTNVLTANTWHHVAVVRTGTTFDAYFDGTRYANYSTTLRDYSEIFRRNQIIGANGDVGGVTNFFPGYIDEIRLSKTARYTSGASITVPTAAFTDDSDTLFLHHFDHGFRDDNTANSTLRNHKIRAFGETQYHNRAHSNNSVYGNQFGGSSVKFDGTGDGIAVTPGTANDFVFTGALTFEFWFMYDSDTGSATCTLLSNRIGGLDSSDFMILFRNFDTKLQIYLTSGWNVSVASPTMASDTWHHVALVRDSSNNVAFFVNGNREQNSSGISATVGSGSSEAIGIGNYVDNSLPFNQGGQGWIDELRVSDTNRYDPTASSIAVPTAPFETDANTKLLMHFDGSQGTGGTPGSRTFKDDQSENRRQRGAYLGSYGSNATPKLSKDQSKWGTSSLTTAGTSDYNFAALEYFNSGTGDFTYEGWFYPTSSGGTQVMFAAQNNSTQAVDLLITSGALKLYFSDNGSSWNIASGTSFGSYNANAWNHFALVRNGNTLELMLNGTRGNTVSFTGSVYAYEDTTRISTPTNVDGFRENMFHVGSIEGTSSVFTGSYNDIRISDTGRYTGSSYTQPAARFVNDSNTVTLLSLDEGAGSFEIFDNNGDN